MVVDFGRDEYKMSEEELRILANKVRVGDLTDVLRVWEKDIKVCSIVRRVVVLALTSCSSVPLDQPSADLSFEHY